MLRLCGSLYYVLSDLSWVNQTEININHNLVLVNFIFSFMFHEHEHDIPQEDML